MRLVNRIRFLFQFFVFLSIFSIVGSIGAWETGSINFLQLLLQLFMFTGTGLFFGKMSKKRILIRMRFKKRRLPVPHAQAKRRIAAANAA